MNKGNELLNKSIDLKKLDLQIGYTSQDLQSEIEKILGETKGYENTLISDEIKSIQANARKITNSSNSNQGFLGKVLNVFKDKKAELAAQTQSLKKQIDNFGIILDKEIKQVNERLPKMLTFHKGFESIGKNINEDLETIDMMKKYLENQKIYLQQKMEEEPALKDDLGHQLKINEINVDYQLALEKEDELKSTKAYIYSLATLMSDHIAVAKNVERKLISTQKTVLPLLSYSAVASTMANELSQSIELVKGMKVGIGNIFVETSKQAVKNTIEISEMQKNGLLDLESINKIAKVMEEAEEKLAKNAIEADRLRVERGKKADQYIQSLRGIQQTQQARILNSFGSKDKELLEMKENIEVKEDYLTKLEDLAKQVADE